jgi:hypothetical protein
MSSRHRLLRLFPQRWQARYGGELRSLLQDMEDDERGLRLGDHLDLARAGLNERGAEIWRRATRFPRKLGLRGAIAGAVLLVFVGSALVLGNAFQDQPHQSSLRPTITRHAILLPVIRPTAVRIILVKPLASATP